MPEMAHFIKNGLSFYRFLSLSLSLSLYFQPTIESLNRRSRATTYDGLIPQKPWSFLCLERRIYLKYLSTNLSLIIKVSLVLFAPCSFIVTKISLLVSN